jgi:hypothetical protein
MEILGILFNVASLLAETVTALSLLYLAYLEWRKQLDRDTRVRRADRPGEGGAS